MSDVISGSKEKTKMHDVSPRPLLSPAEFKRKVQALKKQIYELATLCNVPGCLIIRSPDGSQTYTWPESKDEVKKFAELYFSKSPSGGQKIQVCGGHDFGSVDDQRLKFLSVDEDRRFLMELDAKIERLKMSIKSAEFERNRGECVEEDETLKVSERHLEDAGSESDDLSDEEENVKFVRSLERFTEAFMETFKSKVSSGKRKFKAQEGEPDDQKLKKAKKLSIPVVKKLLHELESNGECSGTDINHGHHGDDETWLTLGLGRSGT